MSEHPIVCLLREVQEQRAVLDVAIAYLERLVERTVHTTVMKEVPTSYAPTPQVQPKPKTQKEDRPVPLKHGVYLQLVRRVVSRKKQPFSVAEIAADLKSETGRDQFGSSIRKALGLLVNTGEVKVAHEGTGRRDDPNTWKTTTRGLKDASNELES